MSPIIQKLIEHIELECSSVDTELAFQNFLDENFTFEKVGDLFSQIKPSQVLDLVGKNKEKNCP